MVPPMLAPSDRSATSPKSSPLLKIEVPQTIAFGELIDVGGAVEIDREARHRLRRRDTGATARARPAPALGDAFLEILKRMPALIDGS